MLPTPSGQPKQSLEINYENVCFLIRLIKYTISRLAKEKAPSDGNLAQILEEDNPEDHEMPEEQNHLQNCIDEILVRELVEGTLSQNTPKKVIIEVVGLIRHMIENKQLIKNSDELIDKFKQIMIETFINGKDHEVRVKTVQIIQMFLAECKSYFRKF